MITKEQIIDIARDELTPIGWHEEHAKYIDGLDAFAERLVKLQKNIMTKTDLKVFSFSGFGNYSQSFGWDNGLSCTLGECTTMERALEDQESLADYNGWSYGLPASPVKGVYYTLNEYGGSRNVEGYVIAFSRRDAIKMLAEFEDNFEVVEYERD